jgi:hypothetical protein
MRSEIRIILIQRGRRSMAVEVSKDFVGGGPGRVGPGSGDRFFYRHNHPGEGENGS